MYFSERKSIYVRPAKTIQYLWLLHSLTRGSCLERRPAPRLDWLGITGKDCFMSKIKWGKKERERLFMRDSTVVLSVLIRMWQPSRVCKKCPRAIQTAINNWRPFSPYCFLPADCSTLLITIPKNENLPKGVLWVDREPPYITCNAITSTPETSTLVSWLSAGSFSPSSDRHSLFGL